MHFLEEELAETRKDSAETVAETRGDTCIQIAKIEDKVYAIFETSEETRRASRQQSEDILLRRNRMWLRCRKSPLKIWKKSLQR